MTLEHIDSILAFVLIVTGVSLIITALNQMVSALLGLRGTHLRWALTTLLTNVDQDLAKHARQISEAVLHHSLISDSSFSRWNVRLFRRWRLASAIRLDELIDILRHLAKPPPEQPPPDGKENVETWDVALGRALDKLDPKAADDVVLVANEVKKLFPNQSAKTESILAPIVESAQTLPTTIAKWFDTVMDRSSQRFAMHMRIWTVIFGVLIAFGLQLDAFSLFKRVSSDAQLRASIIASSDALTKKADDLFAVSTNGSSADYVIAMRQLIVANTNQLNGLAEPRGFTTLVAGKEWLAGELKRANIANSDLWVEKFEAQVPQAQLRLASERLNSLFTDQFMLQLWPHPYPQPFYKDWSPKHGIFWGIMASAVLLSLGAPFWFNVLNNLTSLKPIPAKKQQQEQAESAETD